MIKLFVDRFIDRQDQLKEVFKDEHPGDYEAIVKAVINLISDESDFNKMDADNIHSIDDGEYQGTLVFIIPEIGYQPSNYWAVKVYYGSCSGCDTLQGIQDFCDGKPDSSQIDDYITLCLHVVQQLKEI